MNKEENFQFMSVDLVQDLKKAAQILKEPFSYLCSADASTTISFEDAMCMSSNLFAIKKIEELAELLEYETPDLKLADDTQG